MRAGSVVYGTVGMIGPGTITRLGRVCQRTLSAIEDAFKQFGGGGKDRKAIADLENTVVLDVRAPNSTILPVGVVREAAKRTGLLRGYLNSTTVTNTARLLKSFYDENGYVLCEVSSASIDPSGIVSLSVVEPRFAEEPVGMMFLKEMVVSPEDGRTLTFKKFNEMQERRKVVKKLKREDLNTTFVPTKGRTRGDIIAKTLGMKKGEVFKWDNSRWQSVANSGLFELVRTKPTKDKNGNVQLVVQATEKPTRNLEYGVTKSLYTGEWEGESVSPVSDFSDSGSDSRSSPLSSSTLSPTDDSDEGGNGGGDPDELFVKRGATFRVHKPLNKICYNSGASASLEKTATFGGASEIIGSLSCDVGPVVNYIPLIGGAHSLLTTMTGGGRLTHESSVLAYTSSTIVAKELVPLSRGNDETKKPVVLGLRHSLHASSEKMPLHEAQAAGCNAKIRGYGSRSVGAVSQAATGTVEVRIPSNFNGKYGRDLGVVLFGDWVLSKGRGKGEKGSSEDVFDRKYSVGVGIRGSAMGIPLKYDVGVNKEKDLVTSFGIGGDFQV
ncbi:hypothetical protein TrRE_jg2737 [Triparma retinervis]|uniref:Bacterial surface antigen (D15) domain-containing protein n=1 Tax=Triparma retinervis TaxID=2557542 RepID=A0A9W7E873_9STRA|nr:hypothetical protein TrRE_jg2737 [Triparma retinervis]